jgi:hypothetical protein
MSNKTHCTHIGLVIRTYLKKKVIKIIIPQPKITQLTQLFILIISPSYINYTNNLGTSSNNITAINVNPL